MLIWLAAVLSALLSATQTESAKSPNFDSWGLFSCTRRLDGVYAMSEVYAMADVDCHQYAVCDEGKLSIHMCPSGLAFSPTVYACLPEQEVDCKDSSLSKRALFELAGIDEWFDVLCANYPNDVLGYFSDKRQNCRHFYRCENGYRSDFQCPIDMVFNEELGACLPSKLYACPLIQERDIAPRKVARQIKFFRFHDEKRNDLDSETDELQEGGDHRVDSVRQVKFATTKSVQERQVKFKRVNQLLQQLSDLVKNE